MQTRSKHLLSLTPALLMMSACAEPTDMPAEPVDDQSVSDDFTSDQPIVEDPMAGDTVVEEAPELGRTENDADAGEETAESETGEAAIDDAAKVMEEQSETDDGEKTE